MNYLCQCNNILNKIQRHKPNWMFYLFYHTSIVKYIPALFLLTVRCSHGTLHYILVLVTVFHTWHATCHLLRTENIKQLWKSKRYLPSVGHLVNQLEPCLRMFEGSSSLDNVLRKHHESQCNHGFNRNISAHTLKAPMVDGASDALRGPALRGPWPRVQKPRCTSRNIVHAPNPFSVITHDAPWPFANFSQPEFSLGRLCNLQEIWISLKSFPGSMFLLAGFHKGTLLRTLQRTFRGFRQSIWHKWLAV